MAKRERGTFSPEQIQGALRQGDSPIVLMAKGEFIPGHAVITDAGGNAVDSGGAPLVVVGDPEEGDVPTWDEDTGTWVPGEGGGGGECCTTLVFVNEEPASCDWTMTVNDTWPPFAVNGVGV